MRWMVGVVLVVLLAGCVHHDSGVVTVWSWDIAAHALQSAVPGFYEHNPQYRSVPVQVLDLGNQPVVDRGMAGCAAGGVNLPDVYCLENSKAEIFWSRFPSAFVDLAPLGADALRDQFPAYKWAELTVGPHIYALPWDAGPVVVFYRRDYFKQAGIDAQAIETWDDFKAAGLQIKQWSNGRIKLATMANGDDDDWFRMLSNEGGGYYFDDAGARVTLADAPCVQALSTIKGLADEQVLAYGAWSDQVQNLRNGTVAAALYGAWFEGTIREQCAADAGRWGVIQMPAFQRGGSRTANIGGSALAIPASSRHPDVAWAFMRYALGDASAQVRMLREEGLVPSLLAAQHDPWLQQPQPFWGGQAIWPMILETQTRVHATHESQYYQEAKQIMTSIQADYLDGRYPTAQSALEEGAREISDATGVPR